MIEQQQQSRHELPNGIIEVIYEMGKENSIVQIDGESLAKNLLDLGYSRKMLVPISIFSAVDLNKLASFRLLPQRNIHFYEGSLVNAVKLAYARINEEIGYTVDINIPDEFQESLQELRVDNVVKTFFVGNHNRRLQYIKSAKEGSLSTSMDSEQQRIHAHNFMKESLFGNVGGYTSRAFAHEYEHKRHILQNILLSGPVIFATSLLLQNIGHTIGLTPEATKVLTLVGGVVIGAGATIAVMEYQADKTGTEHMRNLLGSISINRQLLEQRVFEKRMDN